MNAVVPAAPAVAPAALSHTFALARPVNGKDGQPLAALTVAEPEQRHIVNAEREHAGSEAAQAVHMLAALTGLPRESVLAMSIADAQRIQRWMGQVMAEAIAIDAPADPSEGARTFGLVAPIETDAVPVASVTVRAPDLAASIVVEKFKGDGQRLAAMIAELSGLSLPVVLRMKRRDVARIERWLAPFVTGSFSPTGDPGEM